MMGTKTRHHASSPHPQGLFNTVPQNLANCSIIVRLPNLFEIDPDQRQSEHDHTFSRIL